MKNIFLAFLLFFFYSVASAATVAQGFIPTATMGGVTIPLSKAMFLAASSSASNYDTFRYNGSNYQVPVGYKLVIVAQRVVPTSAASASARIGHATATVSDSTIPAGFTVIDNGGAGDSLSITPATLGGIYEVACYIEIAAGKYVTLLVGGNPANMIIMAYLVAV